MAKRVGGTTMALKAHRIGFVGAGNMGEALIRGLLASRAVEASRLVVIEKDRRRAEAVRRAHGVRIAQSCEELARMADIAVLAVKPQALGTVLDGYHDLLNSSHLVVSIAAGVRSAWIEARLAPGPRVVRVMPNTPALVGAGVSVACRGTSATHKDLSLALEIFNAVGVAQSVDDESLMDAVTGLSGSGPAFVFVMLEALADGGVRAGLPRPLANLLAIRTVAGAAKLASESPGHFGALKDMVASPGGTTIVGLQCLEEAGFRAALIRAVNAAARRSSELAEQATC